MMHIQSRTALAAAFAIACVLIIAMVGCSGKGASTNPDPEPEPDEVVLDAEGAMEVALDYSAGTGYAWECELEPEGVLSIADEWSADMSEDEPIDGGPMRDYVLLRAVEPGKATLTCELVRSWEEEDPVETQVYVFEVDDALQITFMRDESDYVIEPERVYNS